MLGFLNENHFIRRIIFLSSYPLYQVFYTRNPKPRPISVQTKVSKDKTLTLETKEQTFTSTDGAATLILFQDSIQVVLKTGMMSYREGHSIEIKLDGSSPVFKRILPTDNNSVKFSNSG